MKLKTYVESFTSDILDMSNEERILVGMEHVFDFDFNLVDDEFWEDFKYYFIRTNYFKELEFDTIGRFKFELENQLWRNQEYYNGLIRSVQEDLPIFENYEMVVDSTGSSKETGESTSEGASKGKNKEVASNTPQVQLNLKDDPWRYASSMGETGSESTSEGKNKIKSDNDSKSRTVSKGKIGGQSYASMVMEYRRTLLSIRDIILKDLDSLFLKIYL